METLLMLFDGCCCAMDAGGTLLAPLTTTDSIIVWAAWRASAPNRQARREAKEKDEPLPPRDIWAWIFVIGFAILVAFGLALIVASTMLMNRVKE